MRLRQWCWAAAWSTTRRRRRSNSKACAVDEPDDLGSGYALEMRAETGQRESPQGFPRRRLWHELLRICAPASASRASPRVFMPEWRRHSSRAAKLARENTGIEKVALSGGCLHNRRLARLLRTGLEEEGFQVFQHRNVSPGDGGLSYGQAVVAAAMLTKPGQYAV